MELVSQTDVFVPRLPTNIPDLENGVIKQWHQLLTNVWEEMVCRMYVRCVTCCVHTERLYV
jgi:hypothetical protein